MSSTVWNRKYMKLLFILTFIANVVLTLISLAMLPDRVAIHFGADGMADGWAPAYVNALLMTGIHLLLFFSLYFSPRLMLLFPAKWINLPNKEYWLAPRNQSRTMEKISSFMWRFGTAMFLFLFVITVLTLQANLSEINRLNLNTFLPALGVLLGYTVWWTITFFRAFRLPSDLGAANQ